MSRRVPPSLAVLVLISSSLSAQTLSIDHQPVACAVAERFPRLEARFAPPDTIATAHVVFQAENAKQWYSIAMKPEGPAFTGALPQPKKSLKAFRYYIEVTDRALGTNRTADYTTSVVANPGECKGKLMAAALGSASVLLQVPAGAAALPAGFASTGVVATASGSVAAATGAAAGGSGGGLGTGAIAGIVAGAGAAVAGVVAVAGKGGDEGSPATTYSGPFTGQYVVTQNSTGSGPGQATLTCLYTRAYSGTMNVKLEQSNGTATGAADSTGTDMTIGVAGGPNCGGTGPGNFMFVRCAVTGPPGNLACSEENTSTSGTRTSTARYRFSGALSGGVISGTVTFSFTGQSTFANGTGTDNASMTYSVTLR